MAEAVAINPPWPEFPPYPEPVQLAEVLGEIVTLIHRFIVLEPEQAVACALWVIHTHCYEEAQRAPILIINAPTRACGKTQLQKLLGMFVRRRLEAANATPASIFRIIDKWNPTLLIDEADTFFKESPGLTGIVNCGYEKGGCVLRVVGDDHEAKPFPVYSPKCIAGIALERHLEEATMSRGIVINLRRKLKHEQVERMRNLPQDAVATLASKVVRVCADIIPALATAEPFLPDELSDRAQDNWEPLFAIAERAGEDWATRARKAALKLAGQVEQQGGSAEELLDNIRDIFSAVNEDRISSADLIGALVSDDMMAWATYNRGRPMSPTQLANKLRQYGVGPQTIRFKRPGQDGISLKGYYLHQFEDAFERYLPKAKSDDNNLMAEPEPQPMPRTDSAY